MQLSTIEIDIIVKIWNTCTLPYDKIFIGLLYSVTNKNYLYKNIKHLQLLSIIDYEFIGRKKYVFFTNKGLRIAKAVMLIKNSK